MLAVTCDDKLEYEDFVECAQRYCKLLKEEHKCDLIIALTHMRMPNDRILASSVPEIDLILGGHDHMTIAEMNENTGVFTVKSGTDFEEFSDLLLYFDVQSKSESRLLKGMRNKNFNKKYDTS
jgi:5'-nucleotidase